MLIVCCSLESDIMLYVDYASVKQRHNCGKGCLAASCAQENPSLGTIGGGVPDDPEAQGVRVRPPDSTAAFTAVK